MNIAVRKLALLEKEMIEREEQIRNFGYASAPVDTQLKERITRLMDRVRVI